MNQDLGQQKPAIMAGRRGLMKNLLASLVVVLAATPVMAVFPGTDLYLPSIAHGQGQCPDGVCAQWRSDVWIYNPSPTSVDVELCFLQRGQENLSPASQSLTVAAGETRELTDVVAILFNLDEGYGALRVTSDVAVVVTGRVYDSNVQTSGGTGSAGQFCGGLPAASAIGAGQSTELIGLAEDSEDLLRSNFGLVEVSGSAATVAVSRCDGAGTVLATRTYELRGREAIQKSVGDVGGPPGSNQRLTVEVTAGSGRVLAFASRLDNRTGDPSTVEMVIPATLGNVRVGTFEGTVTTASGLIDGAIELTISEQGMTAFAGVAGISCGTVGDFVVDFSAHPEVPVAVADGSFVATVTIPYGDGDPPLFTTEWTLSGVFGDDQSFGGSLDSATTGGSGDWAQCNAAVVRSWQAGARP